MHIELRSLALPLSYLFGPDYIAQADQVLYPYGNLTRILPRSAKLTYFPHTRLFPIIEYSAVGALSVGPCADGRQYLRMLEYLRHKEGWVIVPPITETVYFPRLEHSHRGGAMYLSVGFALNLGALSLS